MSQSRISATSPGNASRFDPAYRPSSYSPLPAAAPLGQRAWAAAQRPGRQVSRGAGQTHALTRPEDFDPCLPGTEQPQGFLENRQKNRLKVCICYIAACHPYKLRWRPEPLNEIGMIAIFIYRQGVLQPAASKSSVMWHRHLTKNIRMFRPVSLLRQSFHENHAQLRQRLDELIVDNTYNVLQSSMNPMGLGWKKFR